MIRTRLALLSFFVSILTCIPLLAQTDPSSPDVRPFAPLSGSGIDKVSLVNGTLAVDIPLWSVKQRGNLSMAFHLTYNSGYAVLSENCSIPNNPCIKNYSKAAPSVMVTPMFMVTLTNAGYATYPSGAETDYGYYWNVNTPDGGMHQMLSIGNNQFRSADATGWFFDQPSSTLISKDGVRYVFSAVTCFNGNTNHAVSCGDPSLLYIEDTNGNRITLTFDSVGRNTGWTDSLGTFVPYPLNSYAINNGMTVSGVSSVSTSRCTGPLTATYAEQWQVPGYQGTTDFVFCYASVPIVTNYFGSSPTSEEVETDAATTMLQSVILPDDSQHTFQYTPLQSMGSNSKGEAINYADLTQITLPTGGTIGYQIFLNRQYCQLQANQVNGYPQKFIDLVTSRILNPKDGSPASTWSYSYGTEQVGSNTRTITTTETDPLGQKMVHTLSGLLDSCSYYDTQTQYYDASNLLQRTDTTAYSAQPDIDALPTEETTFQNGGYSLAMGVVPTSATTAWANGATKKTSYSYDSGAGFTATDITFTVTANGMPYGLVTSKVDTDYGSGSPGSTLPTTGSTFTESNSTYFGLNILDHPSNVTVTDANTGIQQVTSYGYDESLLSSGNANAGTDPSTSGWNASPPDGTYRGNQTSITRYWNTPGTNLTTKRTFTDTGLLSTSTEPTNPLVAPASTTSYDYSSTYDGAYLTTTTDSLGHITNLIYDEPSGLPTSKTDANAIPTTYGYDSSSRLTSVNTRGGDHNVASSTTYSYPDPNHVQRADVLNTSIASETVTTTYDGLGREIQIHHADPDDGDEYQDTTYDLLGRKQNESTPYRSKTDSNFYGITQTSYDLFNRVTQVLNPDNTSSTFQYVGASTLATNESNGTTQSQKESRTDGLGRLLAVCEIVSSATPAQQGGDTPSACAMEVTTNNPGFTTTYTQSVNGPIKIVQGAQSRTFAYDSLGHLTDSTNPETGHLQYFYDNDGNVITKKSPAAGDSVGSTETLSVSYTHDALHRITGKSYSVSGASTISAITPSATYSYDQANVNGFSLENPIGRVTSETSSLGGVVQAESIYSYDTVGRVGSHYQCVGANCASYQDVEYHYDGAGNLVSLATPQLQYSNTFNAADHLVTVTPAWTEDADHPAIFFGRMAGQTQYAPNDQWLNVAYGSGVTESYAYQPRWLTGMQTNNTSGTLYSFTVQHAGDGQLQQSTDSVNGNWNYTYDDFNRLLSANQTNADNTITAGLAWDYDRYGNRWRQNLNAGGGTPGIGSVTLSGTEQAVTQTVCVVRNGKRVCNPETVYDTGMVNLTVGSMTQSVSYSGGSTPSTLAAALASAFNSASGAPVTATASGSVISLVATTTGTGSDLSLSVASSTSQPSNFASPSFSGSDSGSSLQGGTTGTGTSTQLVFNLASNQATTNISYDNAGNVSNDSSHAYVYDAENRIEQVDQSLTYIYDAEGRRVGKSNGTVYVVGLSGQVLDELDGGNWTRSEVYADGHHIATVTPSTVYFVHTDWLGTERARTNMAGQLCETFTSQPFGDNLARGGTSGVAACDPSPQFFTGKPRDTESNLDDFGARYFSSQWGRWMSPDWSAKPAGVPYSSFSNPQSLNLYGYVGNDPITGEDPDGHLTFGFGDGYNDGDNQNPTVNTNTSTTPASAVAAAANAFGSDMLGGVGRVDQDSPDGKIGAAIGDFGAALLGAGEVAFGTAGEALGTALDATGVGALAGVPINVVSAGVMAEGGATAAEGAVHLAKDAASDGPYKRPNNATTPEQRKSVQGQACATCGATGQKNYAGHKDSLVEQHYRGGIDKNAMRSPGAVRPECAACSNQQGAYLKTFSNAMKSLFGFN